MKRTWKSNIPGKLGRAIIGSSLLGTSFLGCAGNQPYVEPPAPLGSDLDPVFKLQEEDAEASKYVIYMHEFELNKSQPAGTNTGGWRLNGYGEDHVKQIAVNIKAGHGYPIVVERSQTSSMEGTGYPVHFNDELDATRRQVVVASLEALGVADADSLVIVAPAFAEGYTGGEAARAYTRGLSGGEIGGGGLGGGIGGGGFGGGGVF